MTDQQLYLSIGVPSIVALIGILVNVGYFIALYSRMNSLETRLSAVETGLAAQKVLMDIVLKKLDELEARFHR